MEEVRWSVRVFFFIFDSKDNLYKGIRIVMYYVGFWLFLFKSFINILIIECL